MTGPSAEKDVAKTLRQVVTNVTAEAVLSAWDSRNPKVEPDDVVAALLPVVEQMRAEAAYRAMWSFFLTLPLSPFSDMVQREAMRLRDLTRVTSPRGGRGADPS